MMIVAATVASHHERPPTPKFPALSHVVLPTPITSSEYCIITLTGMHTYVHSYIHSTFMQPYLQTRMHAMDACLHACAHALMSTWTHTFIGAYIQYITLSIRHPSLPPSLPPSHPPLSPQLAVHTQKNQDINNAAFETKRLKGSGQVSNMPCSISSS